MDANRQRSCVDDGSVSHGKHLYPDRRLYVYPGSRATEMLRSWCGQLRIAISEDAADRFVDAAIPLGAQGIGEVLHVTVEEREALRFRTIRPGGWSDEQFRAYQGRSVSRTTQRRRERAYGGRLVHGLRGWGVRYLPGEHVANYGSLWLSGASQTK
jgi:hypothetical protein